MSFWNTSKYHFETLRKTSWESAGVRLTADTRKSRCFWTTSKCHLDTFLNCRPNAFCWSLWWWFWGPAGGGFWWPGVALLVGLVMQRIWWAWWWVWWPRTGPGCGSGGFGGGLLVACQWVIGCLPVSTGRRHRWWRNGRAYRIDVLWGVGSGWEGWGPTATPGFHGGNNQKFCHVVDTTNIGRLIYFSMGLLNITWVD